MDTVTYRLLRNHTNCLPGHCLDHIYGGVSIAHGDAICRHWNETPVGCRVSVWLSLENVYWRPSGCSRKNRSLNKRWSIVGLHQADSTIHCSGSSPKHWSKSDQLTMAVVRQSRGEYFRCTNAQWTLLFRACGCGQAYLLR